MSEERLLTHYPKLIKDAALVLGPPIAIWAGTKFRLPAFFQDGFRLFADTSGLADCASIAFMVLVCLSILLGNKVLGLKKKVKDTSLNEKIQLLTSKTDIDNALYIRDKSIVKSAESFLVITGSRGSNSDYFTSIAERFTARPTLELYRILFGPPRHAELKDHLSDLIKRHSIIATTPRASRLHIARVDINGRLPEHHVCINESELFITLPSPNKIDNFDCGLHIKDPELAKRFADQFRNMHDAKFATIIKQPGQLEQQGS